MQERKRKRQNNPFSVCRVAECALPMQALGVGTDRMCLSSPEIGKHD